MHLGSVGNVDRDVEAEGNILVGSHLARNARLHRKRRYRHFLFKGFATFLCFLLLFLPFVKLFFLLLQPFLVGYLREHGHRIRHGNECSRRVGNEISGLDGERVLVDERGIAQPIGDGIALDTGFHDESIAVVEVQAADLGQRIAAIAEEVRKTVGLLSLAFHQIAGGH